MQTQNNPSSPPQAMRSTVCTVRRLLLKGLLHRRRPLCLQQRGVLRLERSHALKQPAHAALDLLVQPVALRNLAVQAGDVVLQHALLHVPLGGGGRKGAGGGVRRVSTGRSPVAGQTKWGPRWGGEGASQSSPCSPPQQQALTDASAPVGQVALRLVEPRAVQRGLRIPLAHLLVEPRLRGRCAGVAGKVCRGGGPHLV